MGLFSVREGLSSVFSSFLWFGGLVSVSASLAAFAVVDVDDGAREGVEGDCDWAWRRGRVSGFGFVLERVGNGMFALSSSCLNVVCGRWM